MQTSDPTRLPHAPAPSRPGGGPGGEAGPAPLRPLPYRGVRAILVALLLIPVCCYWSAEALVDVILSLLVPPVALLLGLILLNSLVRAATRRPLLTATELVIIYGMLQTATAISAEWMWVVHPLIATFTAFSERESKFRDLILPHIPDQLHIKDRTLLGSYVTGGAGWSEFVAGLPTWAGPVFWWTVVLFLVLLAGLCLNVLMRQEWTQREKLSFPIIQLPLAMAQGGPEFWRSRPMWLGFGIVAAIDLLNGFAFLYPSIPMLNVRFLGDAQKAFPDAPFNAIGWTPIGLFPFIVGLSVFLPVDLMVSVLFFFLLRKASQVVAASMGYTQGVFGGGGLVPSPPYFSEQTWGAFLGLFVSGLWIARPYLREVWRDIVTGARCPDGGLSRRWAFALFLACWVALGALGAWWRIGFGFTMLYLGVFFAFSMALTRIRAQLGPPTHEMAFMGPNQLLVDFHGTQGVPVGVVARAVTLFHFTNRIHRTDPMPTQLELMKMGERTGTSQGVIFVGVLLAILAGSVFGHLTHIWLGYRYGVSMAGGDVANVVYEFTRNPKLPNGMAMLFVGVGFAVVLALNYLRFQFPWFPLHPMGYALTMNFGVDYYWFSLLVAMALKAGVQRYAGLKGYRQLHHAALGVILGEFAVEAVWSTVTMVTRMATYSISINGRLGWNQ